MENFSHLRNTFVIPIQEISISEPLEENKSSSNDFYESYNNKSWTLKNILEKDALSDTNLVIEDMTNAQEKDNLLKIFNCGICTEKKPYAEVVSMPECCDIFCILCIKEYIKIRIEESNVLQMPCPNHVCKTEMPEDFIRKNISSELFNKYCVFKRNEELCQCPLLRWCPVPNCTGYDVGGLKKELLVCNVCSFKFCYYCHEAWHKNNKCKGEIDKEFDQWSSRNDIKYCPNCRRRVQKFLGCDHMTCIKCNYEWCWLCGEKYNSMHFSRCRVKNSQKLNPPVLKIIGFILCPVLIFFVSVWVVLRLFEDMRLHSSNKTWKRLLDNNWFYYFISIFIGILIFPLFDAIGPFACSIYFCVDYFHQCGCKRCPGVVFGIIFGLIGAPGIIVLSILFVCMIHVLGVSYIFIKIYVFFRRCKDPNFLMARGSYGNI